MYRQAGTVVDGSTSSLEKVYGRRVRPRRNISLKRFNGPEVAFGADLILGPDRVGFVGRPNKDGIVLAFPKPGLKAPQKIEALLRGTFDSVWVDSTNFKDAFAIEAF